MKIVKEHLIVFLVLFGSIIFTFWQLPSTFFQQDEWWGFGSFIQRESVGGAMGVILESSLASGKVHFNPLGAIGLYTQFKVFGLNFAPYAVFSIFIHMLNVYAVYCLAQILLRKKYLSFFTALLFGVNSISHQATSWVAASLQIQGATFFSIFSIIYFLKYLENNTRKALYVSYGFIFIALLFKETAFSVFLLLPAFWLLYPKKETLFSFSKTFMPLAVFILFYLVLRIFIWFIGAPIVLGGVEAQQTTIPIFIYRLLALPLRVLPQAIVTQKSIISISDMIIRLAYPQFLQSNVPNPYISQTIGFDLVCYFLSMLFLSVLFFVYHYFRKIGKLELFNTALIAVLITFFSALPTVFIPGKAGFASIIEPRHLYGSIVGSSLFVVLIFFALSTLISKNRNIRYFTFAFCLLSIVFIHIKDTKTDLSNLEKISQLRKSFLIAIYRAYPTLPDKVIFYTKSDSPYYGMPEEEKILPVQSGFGRMLMLWYQSKEKFPGCLYDGAFLHDLLAQGYRECNGRGVGYYRQYDTLVNAIKDNHVGIDNIISYSWDSKSQKFMDITDITRQNLSKKIDDETTR